MQSPSIFWDRVADGYAKRPVRDEDAYVQTLERTRTYLNAGDHLLELGCGTGTTALKLAPHVARVTASDVSGNMIAIAESKVEESGATNVRFVKANVLDDTLEDTAPDVIAAFNLLHLLADQDAVLRQVHGLLKPGGLFISKTPGEPGPSSPLLFRVLKVALPVLQWLGKAPYVKFMSREQLVEIMEANGFEVIETGAYPVSPPNNFIVARKVQSDA